MQCRKDDNAEDCLRLMDHGMVNLEKVIHAWDSAPECIVEAVKGDPCLPGCLALVRDVFEMMWMDPRGWIAGLFDGVVYHLYHLLACQMSEGQRTRELVR